MSNMWCCPGTSKRRTTRSEDQSLWLVPGKLDPVRGADSLDRATSGATTFRGTGKEFRQKTLWVTEGEGVEVAG